MRSHPTRQRLKTTIWRLLALAAGLVGALGLLAEQAQAGMQTQHCEPVLRR